MTTASVTTMPGTKTSLLGKGSREAISKTTGIVEAAILTDIFKPFEGDKKPWEKRGLPTAETPVEAMPIEEACTPVEAAESLKVDVEKLAFRRSQVIAFAEKTKLIPNGGNAGAWMLYREGRDLRWAYIYRSTADDAGFLSFDYDGYEDALPAHEGHVLVVPERR